VITSSPEFFSVLSKKLIEEGRQVYIVSSRSDQQEARIATLSELRALGIAFTELYLLPSIGIANQRCPYEALDWYQKYLWQKVDFCKTHNIVEFFEDDEKVVDLFRQFAPEIKIVYFKNGMMTSFEKSNTDSDPERNDDGSLQIIMYGTRELVVNGESIKGWQSDQNCPKCNELFIYSEDYDAFFCGTCNEWLEAACSDPECDFCGTRPPFPMKQFK
jgi:hypothetical protein